MRDPIQHRWWQRRWLLGVVAVLVLTSRPLAYADSTQEPTAAEEQTVRSQFDQAIQRLGTNESGQAAADLLSLADHHPHSTMAPEALFAAAHQYEETLAQPDRALELYQRLIKDYPESRLLRRAGSRTAQLTVSLRSGAAPLLRFMAIVRNTTDSSPERALQLTALLREHPQFALADQATYLLFDGALRRNDPQVATLYRQLVDRFPSSDWTARGQQSLAEWQLGRGRLGAARTSYTQLAQRPEPLWQKAAMEGLRAVSLAERRRLFAALGGLILASALVGIGVRRRKQLWPPPAEVAYYLPVGLFFVFVAALVQGATFARPLLVLVIGGVLLCWLSAAAARGQPGPRSLWFGALWRGGLALLLCYLAIERQGLWDLVLETLRNGPDQ